MEERVKMSGVKSPIEEFLEKAKGLWLRAEHVQVGDRIQILDEPVVDEKTFDRPYVVLRGRLLRTGEEFNVRLGSQNVARVTEALGTKSWKGGQLEVLSIENFPGLGKRGILFRGVRAAEALPKQAELGRLSPQAVEALQKAWDVVELGVALNEQDFSLIPAAVRAELLRLGLVERTKQGLYRFDPDRCKQYLQASQPQT